MPWDVDDPLRADAEFVGRLEDLGPALARVRDEVLVPAIESNFATESAAGNLWRPLAPATIADRLRKGFDEGPILRRTGDLASAATGHREVGSDYVEVGLADGHPYGKYHASSAPRSRIPLRDFLAVPEEAVEKCGEILSDHVEGR